MGKFDHLSDLKTYLECPCCGDVAIWEDDDGLFWDGDSLTCGCVGQVSFCSETEPDVTIWGDEPCPKCHGDGETNFENTAGASENPE